MRILHVGPMYAPAVGGGEAHLQMLSEGLAARGHLVTVFTANVTDGLGAWNSSPGGLADAETINGVRVVRFDPTGGRAMRWFERLTALPGGWRAANALFTSEGHELLRQGPTTLQMVGAILREPTDVVGSINWYWPQAVHAHLASRFKPVPLIGIPLFHTAQPWCQRAIYDRMLARCDGLAVATEHEQQYAERRGGRGVDVVGVGVNPADYERRDGAAIRARYRMTGNPVVGYVGRQEANKGLVRLLEAMRVVWRRHPDARLVLAGHSAPDVHVRGALERLPPIERARVILLGAFPTDQKASVFDAFDVFAMPSKEESFGIAYLEAWMCRKPVVGARIGATACVIDDGRDGLLADADDAADIARALTALLADPALRSRMGDAGHAKTMARHTWSSVVDRAESLYRRVVGAKP